MEKIRVGINGFGRIGRAVFRGAHERDDLEVVAINDLGDPENLAYLLKYDTVYGPFEGELELNDGVLVVDGANIPFLSEKDPAAIPWGEHNVDVVIEATGVFASYEKAKAHLAGGAKRVVISAPVKDDPSEAGVTGGTVLMGVNDEDLATCQVSSNASCTTNAGSPLVGILDAAIGIEKAMLNTVHGYTSTQNIVDSPHRKDFRRGRTAAQNIIPTTTGAAIATTLAHTQLEGNFDGIAIRVPVPAGSIADITFIAKRDTTAEEVNEALKKAASDPNWEDVFAVTEDPVVSSDILGDPHASIADLGMTRVVGGNLVKVMAWYDNEVGYAHALIDHAVTSGLYATGQEDALEEVVQ